MRLIFKLLLIISNCFYLTYSFAEETSLKKAVLSTHNALRAKHHADELTWDDELANFALQHANKCIFKHSHASYGENLSAGYPSISAAIQGWYNEQQYYSYKNPSFSTKTGHFTQLIWKGTKKIGCAYVPCNGKNRTPGNFLVCEYSPAGNVLDEKYFLENVLPE